MHTPSRSLYEFHGPASEAAQWSLRQAERGALDADGDLLEPPEPQPRVHSHALAHLLVHASVRIHLAGVTLCYVPQPRVRCSTCALLHLRAVMCLKILTRLRLWCHLQQGPLGKLTDHVIICGSEDAFVNFAEQACPVAAQLRFYGRQDKRRSALLMCSCTCLM